MEKKESAFPVSYVTEADRFLDTCNKIPSFEDFVEGLSLFNEKMAKDIAEKKNEFMSWYTQKSQHKYRLEQHWCRGTLPDTPTTTTTTTNDSSVSESEAASSTPPPPAVTVVEGAGATAVQRMHWYKFMCLVLRETIARLKPEYIPIMGDLIRHITCNGQHTPPHLRFVIHPKEEKMYYEMQHVMTQVTTTIKNRGVKLSDHLDGDSFIRVLPDGRKQFVLLFVKKVK